MSSRMRGRALSHPQTLLIPHVTKPQIAESLSALGKSGSQKQIAQQLKQIAQQTTEQSACQVQNPQH